MKRLSEICNITGVTRRTLQEYERIGLLKPTIEENGYWMYTDDDIATILVIQLLRMADYKRNEIKGILQADNLALAMNSMKNRLEEKRRIIDGMLGFVDAMQRVMEKGYDLKVLQTLYDFSIKAESTTSITQMYEDLMDYYSSASQDVRDITFDVGYRAAALAAVKNLPIESPTVQEKAADCYAVMHEMMISIAKNDAADGDPDSEDFITYLEEGGSLLAILSDDEVEDLINEFKSEESFNKYYRHIEMSFGEGSIEYILNTLSQYARENYPIDEEYE